MQTSTTSHELATSAPSGPIASRDRTVLPLPHIGTPGHGIGACSSSDVEPSTGRLLSVAELQCALRAARRRSHTGSGSCTPRVPAVPTREQSSAQITERTATRVTTTVEVLAAHAGAGASTVALALADAASCDRSVQLIEQGPPVAPSLGAATTCELGATEDGTWLRGSRGTVTIDRANSAATASWPTAGEATFRVVDLGLTAVSAAPRAGIVVLVCRVSVPGIRQTERLLANLNGLVVLAAIGPARWPRPVLASGGSRLRRLREAGQVVAVPFDQALAVTGVSPSPLPKAVLAAARVLLQHVDSNVPEPRLPYAIDRRHRVLRWAGAS